MTGFTSNTIYNALHCINIIIKCCLNCEKSVHFIDIKQSRVHSICEFLYFVWSADFNGMVHTFISSTAFHVCCVSLWAAAQTRLCVEKWCENKERFCTFKSCWLHSMNFFQLISSGSKSIWVYCLSRSFTFALFVSVFTNAAAAAAVDIWT